MTRRHWPRRDGESGFTMIEVVAAMSVFAIAATALLGVLVSGIATQQLARQKRLAQQAANAQLELVRSLDYDAVGTPSGNPPGTVASSRCVGVVLGLASCASATGLDGTVDTRIEFVNDAGERVPVSYRQAAFYKRVTVTVTRTGDGKQLSRMVTYVAPGSSGATGGISEAELNATVVDIGNNTPVEGQLVSLATGPSAPRNDTTDPNGLVKFAALMPNPTSGPSAYYNLSLIPPTGLTLLREDNVSLTPSSANAHVQLAPSETRSTTLRVYRPSTLTIVLRDTATGNPYTGTATVTVTSSRGSQTFAYPGGTFDVTSVAGEPIAPSSVTSSGYTVSVTNGFLAPSVTLATVPDAYPNNLQSTFTLAGRAAGSVPATVLWAGLPVNNATVTLTGPGYSATKSTNSSGLSTFDDVPAGPGYTLTATKSGQTVSTTFTVGAGAATPVTVSLPTGSLTATVRWLGLPVASCANCVTLSGGNLPSPVVGSTDVNGQAQYVNVPVGTGYTVTVVRSGQTAQATGLAVANGSTTTTTVTMPTGTLNVTVQWAGRVVPGATVTVTGGPFGPIASALTNGSGVASFTVPTTGAATPYTVSVPSFNGGSGSVSVSTVPASPATNATITLTPTKSVTVTVQRAGGPYASQTVNISVTGGPNSGQTYSFSGTTNSSSRITVTVPQGTGTYTVRAYNCGLSNNRNGTNTVSAGAGATSVTVNMTVTTPCP